MNTLHGIRHFALSAALGLSALTASALPALADRTSDAQSVAGTFADLGQITVRARREAAVADLGSMVVSAPRLKAVSFADLGSMTVTASRIADTRVADLGALTVTAKRSAATTVAAAQSSDRFWK